MQKVIYTLLSCAVLLLSMGNFSDGEAKVDAFEADLSKHQVQMHWKKDRGQRFKSLKAVTDSLEAEGCSVQLVTNAGMYMENRAPLGLYIEKGRQLTKLNTRENAHGNFYLHPNGVFYVLESGRCGLATTAKFDPTGVHFATQSGPMLLVDGKMNEQLNEGSENLNIRNGVGILPNGNPLFACSIGMINFYDFASYFKSKGCKNALYLDGFVSRMYCPSIGWEQQKGNFGVMISVVEN